jgi:hypothetical protein
VSAFSRTCSRRGAAKYVERPLHYPSFPRSAVMFWIAGSKYLARPGRHLHSLFAARHCT